MDSTTPHAEHDPTHTTQQLGGRSDIEEVRKRNTAARHLLQEWLADESGYDEETWPLLKEGLEANRTAPSQKLFRD